MNHKQEFVQSIKDKLQGIYAVLPKTEREYNNVYMDMSELAYICEQQKKEIERLKQENEILYRKLNQIEAILEDIRREL